MHYPQSASLLLLLDWLITKASSNTTNTKQKERPVNEGNSSCHMITIQWYVQPVSKKIPSHENTFTRSGQDQGVLHVFVWIVFVINLYIQWLAIISKGTKNEMLYMTKLSKWIHARHLDSHHFGGHMHITMTKGTLGIGQDKLRVMIIWLSSTPPSGWGWDPWREIGMSAYTGWTPGAR